MLTILSSVAEEESRSISENIKWRFKKKFEGGKLIINTKAEDESRSISENFTWGLRRRFEQGKVIINHTKYLFCIIRNKFQRSILTLMFVYDKIITNIKVDGGEYELGKDLVFKLLHNNNGVLEARQVAEAGIDNKILQRLTQTGEIERVGRGLYIDANYIEDEYLVTQYRCKKGIYSHETALFFHNLSDRTPFQLMLTIPAGYNTRILKDKDKYKFFYCKKELYEIGKMKLKSPYGNEIIVYDKERTICDCLRKKDKMDIDLILTAVKLYMSETGADFARLIKYSEIFKLRDLVQQYMEVLT